MKYRLNISYDGTEYGGWQIQPNAVSIQALIEKALSTLLRKEVKICGSGRTDSGVHALEQVAHFEIDEPVDLKRTLHSLNGILPRDIRILDLFPVPDSFHARFGAKGKIYRYHVQIGEAPLPMKLLYSIHIPYHLDRELVAQGAAICIGTKDFTSFSNEAHRGSASRNPIRTLRRLDIIPEEGGFFFEFEGDGFLYKMVRNIVGTLLDIGRGHLPLENLTGIFEAKDRSYAGKAAPAKGLFLVKVLY